MPSYSTQRKFFPTAVEPVKTEVDGLAAICFTVKVDADDDGWARRFAVALFNRPVRVRLVEGRGGTDGFQVLEEWRYRNVAVASEELYRILVELRTACEQRAQYTLTDIGDHRRSGVAEPVEVPVPDRAPDREAEPVREPAENRR